MVENGHQAHARPEFVLPVEAHILPQQEVFDTPSYAQDLQAVLATVPSNGVRFVHRNGKGMVVRAIMEFDGVPVIAVAINPPYRSLHPISLFPDGRESEWGALPWQEPSTIGDKKGILNPLSDVEKAHILTRLGHTFSPKDQEQTFDDFFKETMGGYKKKYAELRKKFFGRSIDQPLPYIAQLYDAAIRVVGEYQQNPS